MRDEELQVGVERDDFRVLDAGALRALAHPLRVQIYDILSQYGPQTASSLAELTGESSGATSYHLRALAKHALIIEMADRGTARERWWERPVGGVSFINPQAMKTPSGRAATQVVMTEFYSRRHQQLMSYIAHRSESETESWKKAAILSTGTARLTRTQLRDLTRRMQSLIDETVDLYREQDGDDVRPVTIRADIFPLPETSVLK